MRWIPAPAEASEEQISLLMADKTIVSLAEEFNNGYLSWEETYYRTPEQYDAVAVWRVMRHLRARTASVITFGDRRFSLNLTGRMSEDLRFIDGLGMGDPGASMIAEAIASSRMEGATTPTDVAERMLRSGRIPEDIGERMIADDYRAMLEIDDSGLTPDLVKSVHRTVTRGTLDDSQWEGRFRESDDIVVGDPLGERDDCYIPPSCDEIPRMVEDLCVFASDPGFHPIVRAIAVHFMIGHIHPFVDGNGRTARVLFYRCALAGGRDLRHVPISTIIGRTKGRYLEAYRRTESDNDLTYFVRYHLDCIRQSVKGKRERRPIHSVLDGTASHAIEARAGRTL